MQTSIINLFAGPGAGKTTIASGLMYELKKIHLSVDNPYEFPKNLAWDENKGAIKDQFYITANQHRNIWNFLSPLVPKIGRNEYF